MKKFIIIFVIVLGIFILWKVVDVLMVFRGVKYGELLKVSYSNSGDMNGNLDVLYVDTK